MRTPNRARAIALGVPGLVTVVWAVAVSLTVGWGRVLDNWAASLTMLFGSFLSGSSPLGGGAVAFPVLTKVLDVPGAVARTFGLSVQAVGMTMATVGILVFRRPVERTAIALAAPAAVLGLVAGLFLLGRPDDLFWPPSFSGSWVKATFSVVLASVSGLMVRRLGAGSQPAPGRLPWSAELRALVVLAGVLGGLLSSVTGVGANVLVFVVLVVVVGVDPRQALPTSVVVMATVSLVGLLVLGVGDGQLDVAVMGDRVVEVGSDVVDLDTRRFDLLGLWLAAVPVVAWGAPLGSWVAARIRERVLVQFVAVLAAVEVVTTLVLVDDLRSSPAMMTSMAVGLLVLPTSLLVLARRARSRAVSAP